MALGLLGRAAKRFHEETGFRTVIVGGAAVSFYTQGQILSGDFDLMTDTRFHEYVVAEGFIKEDRPGWVQRGYYHPDIPNLGFEMVSGALFDGKADWDKVLTVPLGPDGEVIFASVEDLIADRLSQHAAISGNDTTPAPTGEASVIPCH